MAWPTTSRHQRGYGTDNDKMRKLLMEAVVTYEQCERNALFVIAIVSGATWRMRGAMREVAGHVFAR